jgi:hypothetical protein
MGALKQLSSINTFKVVMVKWLNPFISSIVALDAIKINIEPVIDVVLKYLRQ